jgi:hypothetical protein
MNIKSPFDLTSMAVDRKVYICFAIRWCTEMREM